MRLVILESPWAGDRDLHVAYLRAALRDCLLRGEAPFACHALYALTGAADDDIPAERRLGIDAGLAWGLKAASTVVYCDLGVSAGMAQGIGDAHTHGRPIEYRRVPGWASRAA